MDGNIGNIRSPVKDSGTFQDPGRNIASKNVPDLIRHCSCEEAGTATIVQDSLFRVQVFSQQVVENATPRFGVSSEFRNQELAVG
jgi:hypothetical protein